MVMAPVAVARLDPTVFPTRIRELRAVKLISPPAVDSTPTIELANATKIEA
jgi:hypothetical protein